MPYGENVLNQKCWEGSEWPVLSCGKRLIDWGGGDNKFVGISSDRGSKERIFAT